VSVLLLNQGDIAQIAPTCAEVVSLVEETYRMQARGGVEVPAKIGVYPHGSHSFLHAMPAWVSGLGALGLKWVSFFPENASRGKPVSSGLVLLNDAHSGLPLAILEGMWITYARTAACAAVAARALVSGSPRRLGLVGCGGLARWSLRMIGAVLPSVEEVFVASTRRETREAFCAAMAKEGRWRLKTVDDVRGAVENMDIVVSSVPKLDVHPVSGKWWSKGAVFIPLDVTGAWDDSLYAMADRIVCDGTENLRKALERYRPDLTLDPTRLVALQDIALGTESGRRTADDRVLAFITGIASLDMALASELYRRALHEGRGWAFDFGPFKEGT
jgi:ornithine cyclodeaminase/alanine dehydrogenase-like protein (mu-crystallin family)